MVAACSARLDGVEVHRTAPGEPGAGLRPRDPQDDPRVGEIGAGDGSSRGGRDRRLHLVRAPVAHRQQIRGPVGRSSIDPSRPTASASGPSIPSTRTIAPGALASPGRLAPKGERRGGGRGYRIRQSVRCLIRGPVRGLIRSRAVEPPSAMERPGGGGAKLRAPRRRFFFERLHGAGNLVEVVVGGSLDAGTHEIVAQVRRKQAEGAQERTPCRPGPAWWAALHDPLPRPEEPSRRILDWRPAGSRRRQCSSLAFQDLVQDVHGSATVPGMARSHCRLAARSRGPGQAAGMRGPRRRRRYHIPPSTRMVWPVTYAAPAHRNSIVSAMSSGSPALPSAALSTESRSQCAPKRADQGVRI